LGLSKKIPIVLKQQAANASTKPNSKGKVRGKACGDITQSEGIDYNETFSHVSSKDSFRIGMALVGHFDIGCIKSI
jgi:hypothetical protein